MPPARFSVVLLLVLLAASIGQGRVLFVSDSGRDDNPGTHFYPYATLQKAADAAEPGDSVYVLAGYYKEKVLIRNIKGSKDKPVVFKALGEVVLEGPDDISLKGYDLKIGDYDMPLSSQEHPYYPYYPGAVVRIENCSNVRFDNFIVRDSKWLGIAAYNCEGLTIFGCTVTDTMASGIYVLDSKKVLVAHNEVMRACGYLHRQRVHGSQEFVSMVNCVDFEVAYNRVHESGTWERVEGKHSGVGGEGIDAKEHSQNGKIHHNYVYNLSRLGIYIDAWDAQDLRNVEVYNNVVHDCLNGIAIGAEQGGTVAGLKIYNNVLYRNRGAALELFSWGKNGRKRDIKIYNNTICNNQGTGITLGTELSENIEVFNNIAVKNGKRDFSAGTAVNVTEGGNIFGRNPRFVDMDRGDFRLTAESPAIDTGEGQALGDRDMGDGPRVVGEKVDAGAYELGSKPESPRAIFVSKKGSDDNTGTIFSPVATLQKAADTAGAGDSVYVMPGYYEQKAVLKNKATKEKPILYKAVGRVIIDGPGDIMLTGSLPEIRDANVSISSPKHLYYPYYRGAVIRVEDSSHVTIDGFDIRDSEWFGISGLYSNNISVLHCNIQDTMSSGIYILESKNITVGYNEVMRACGFNRRIESHGSQECISIVNCDGFEVMYNRVHEPAIYSWTEGGGTGVGGEGIDAKEHSKNGSIHHNYVYNLERGAIYCDAWNSHDFGNIDVYNNVVHNCTGGMGVGAEDGGTASNIRFYNNVIYNIKWGGFGIASWGPNGDKKEVKVYNNIIYNCGLGGISLGDERNSGIEVFNNISFKNGPKGEDNYDPGTATNVKAGGNLFGIDPRFVNISFNNFRLSAGSAAIDSAVEYTVPPLDMDDRPRTTGAAMDVGPFEYQK